MEKLVMLLIGLALITQAPVFAADVEVVAEVDAQIFKLYETGEFSEDVEVETEGASYLLGVDIGIGKLTLAPRIGVFSSKFEVAEEVELENSAGFAAGISGAYSLLDYGKFNLSAVGGYSYGSAEVDKVNFLSAGVLRNNPLRNDLTFHNYAVGMKVSAKVLPLELLPYVSAIYSDSVINFRVEDLMHTNADIDFDAVDNFGLRVGLEGSPMDNLMLKAEAKLIDETGVRLSCAYKF